MKKIDLSFLSDKQNKELILYILLSIVIIVLDFSFVLKRQRANLAALGPQLKEARQKIKDSVDDDFSVQRLKQRLEELSEAVSLGREGIVEEGQIPALMGEISKLGDKAGLKIMQIRPQKEIRSPDEYTTPAGEEYYILPFSLIARGNYHSLGQFLHSLETSQHFIKVETLDIMPQGGTSLAHEIRLSISTVVKKSL